MPQLLLILECEHLEYTKLKYAQGFSLLPFATATTTLLHRTSWKNDVVEN